MTTTSYFYGISENEYNRESTHPANRFAKVIKSLFENSHRLTTKRKDLLRTWEKNSRRRGVTIQGIKMLEKMLNQRIQLLDSNGKVIYPGVDKYLKHGAIMKVYRFSYYGNKNMDDLDYLLSYLYEEEKIKEVLTLERSIHRIRPKEAHLPDEERIVSLRPCGCVEVRYLDYESAWHCRPEWEEYIAYVCLSHRN